MDENPARLLEPPQAQAGGGYPEPTLLAAGNESAWTGFRVGIFQAVSHQTALSAPHAGLAMVLKGRTRARIVSRGQEWDISPGPDTVGFFAPQLQIDSSRWQCEAGAERLTISLDFSVLERWGDLEAMLPPRREMRQDLSVRDPQLASIMRLVAAEVRDGSPHGELYATSLSIALACRLFGRYASGGRAMPRERGTLQAGQKSAVLGLVEQRLGGNITLDDLAAAAGISRFHFLRLFKNTFGVTPHHFILERRIDAALRLLDHTELPLALIAAQTGFSSQSHLSTAMRRHLGCTPGQRRRLVVN
jgi:AraC family transcriptional regulator